MNLLFFFMLISILACGQQSQKDAVNSQAKPLTDSALKKAMYEQDYEQALSLLNKAVEIDSNYFPAYQNKLTFETSLREYKNALKTAIHIIRLQPNVPDYYVTAGVLYKIEGDSIASINYLQKGLAKFEMAIETTGKTDAANPMLLVNKALTLILLDKQKEGNSILTNLYKIEKDEIMKEGIGQFMNKSKEEILLFFLNQPDVKQVSYPVIKQNE